MKKINPHKLFFPLFIFCLTCSGSFFAQTPGGVAGARLWIKSDASTSTSVNGATNGTWSSIMPTPAVGLTAPVATNQPIYRNGAGLPATNRFNYNPYIEFDGVNDRLRQTASIDLGNALTTGISVYQVVGWTSGIVSIHWQGPNGRFKLKGDGIHQISRNSAALGTNNQFTHVPTYQGFLASIRGTNVNTTGRFNGALRPQQSNGIPDIGTNISIGGNVANSEFMNGGCAEFIVFPSILSVADNLKVESYLAIKYGITLGTSAIPSNYTLSNTTVIWTGTAAYQNNIIGIARDATTLLLQKQSHNYDDTVRLYKGTLAATNIANSSTFALDNSAVIAGANTGRMCATASANAEVPTGLFNCALFSRLEREWRITKTNYAENFNMDFRLGTCANLGSVNPANLRLLVDDDGNFSNGGTQCFYNGDGTGIALSYANPFVTVTGISNTHIPNNQTRFITIGSASSLTPLPIELVHFQASLNGSDKVDLTWKTSSERDNDYFTVEKSTDGFNWDFLAKVKGAGTTNVPQDYLLIDENPRFGMNYYKLKQTDFDGMVQEEGIRSVELSPEELFTVSPVPSNNFVTIFGENMQEYKIDLFNSLGERLYVAAVHSSKTEMELDVRTLSSGIYYVMLTNETSTSMMKILVSK